MTRRDVTRVVRLKECIQRFFELEVEPDIEQRLVETTAVVRLLEREAGVNAAGTARRKVDLGVRAQALADKAREVA